MCLGPHPQALVLGARFSMRVGPHPHAPALRARRLAPRASRRRFARAWLPTTARFQHRTSEPPRTLNAEPRAPSGEPRDLCIHA
jgi:hypothetical protein